VVRRVCGQAGLWSGGSVVRWVCGQVAVGVLIQNETKKVDEQVRYSTSDGCLSA